MNALSSPTELWHRRTAGVLTSELIDGQGRPVAKATMLDGSPHDVALSDGAGEPLLVLRARSQAGERRRRIWFEDASGQGVGVFVCRTQGPRGRLNAVFVDQLVVEVAMVDRMHPGNGLDLFVGDRQCADIRPPQPRGVMATWQQVAADCAIRIDPQLPEAARWLLLALPVAICLREEGHELPDPPATPPLASAPPPPSPPVDLLAAPDLRIDLSDQLWAGDRLVGRWDLTSSRHGFDARLVDGAGETRASLTGAPAGLASLTDEVTLSGPDGDRWVTATVTRNPDGSRRKLGLQLALAMVGPGGATGTIPAVTANPGPQSDAVIDGVPMGRLDNAPAHDLSGRGAPPPPPFRTGDRAVLFTDPGLDPRWRAALLALPTVLTGVGRLHPAPDPHPPI